MSGFWCDNGAGGAQVIGQVEGQAVRQAVHVGHQQVGTGRVQGVVVQVDFKLILLQIGKGEKDFKLPLFGKYDGEKKKWI